MEILNKAKSILGTVNVKANELVYEQKCNIQMAKICAELKKNYEKLGRLTYRKLNGVKVDDALFDSVVDAIEVLKYELDAVRNGNVSDNSIVFENGELVDGEIPSEMVENDEQ